MFFLILYDTTKFIVRKDENLYVFCPYHCDVDSDLKQSNKQDLDVTIHLFYNFLVVNDKEFQDYKVLSLVHRSKHYPDILWSNITSQ